MKLYYNDFTDPYFNLASEQFLLDTEDDDIFMLWRNDRSVIIGRNQNAYAEIDRDFVDQNGIKVVRRLTGGGAVFHDLGNVNFTFIVPKSDAAELDFKKFCQPVVDALKKLGVPAEISGRNDLTAEGRKFSGTAQCVYNGKVMHHGTLLFSVDMSSMSGALRVDEEKMKSKGVKSVRSRVCNLSEYLPDMDVLELKKYLEDSVDAEKTGFSPEQIAAIEELRDKKYATWEWNYGVSKTYEHTVKKRFDYGIVELSYTAEKGRLTDISFTGDYFGVKDTKQIEERLIGKRLLKDELMPSLSDIGRYISGAEPEQIYELFQI